MLQNHLQPFDFVLSQDWDCFVVEILFLHHIFGLVILVDFWGFAVYQKSEFDCVTNSQSDFVRNKVSELSISVLVLDPNVICVYLEFIFELVEVIDEIVLSVPLNTICWRAGFPILSNGFSSHVQLNKLLELVVGAPKPVF